MIKVDLRSIIEDIDDCNKHLDAPEQASLLELLKNLSSLMGHV
jgi:hypothetical protein